jgi:heat-inducible transcriptional repressor
MVMPALSERTGRILAILVREYISSGEPVGSLVLTRRGHLGLSSATIRHVLARLEEDGYLQQPHTSAGRVPTDRAYRFYVDLLLDSPRSGRSAGAVEARVRQEVVGVPPLMNEMLSNVSHVLSEVSRHVGFALPPAGEVTVFQRIEFIPLSATKTLVVVVSKGGHVTQKVIDLDSEIPAEQLHEAATYLNTEFSGMTIRQVREAVMERLKEEWTLYDTLLAQTLRLAQSSFDEPASPPLFVDGAASLMEEAVQHSGASTLTTIRALLEMMEEKQRLVRILNEYIDGPGLTVIIGAEHTAPDLRPFSVIAATYMDGDTTGTVGVIGPTRMRYSRAIAAVDGVARALSRVLNDETN